MRKYYVTFRVEARYVAEVEAENLEDALKEAEAQYIDADFGEARDIDGEKILAEDEDGNFLWEKD